VELPVKTDAWRGYAEMGCGVLRRARLEKWREVMRKKQDDISADERCRKSPALDDTQRRAMELFERLVELEKERDEIRAELAKLLGIAIPSTTGKEP
jgi:hypothetical protein